MINYQERYTILCRDVLFGSSRSDISAIGITDSIRADSDGGAQFYIVSRFNIVPVRDEPVDIVLKWKVVDDSEKHETDELVNPSDGGIAIKYPVEFVNNILNDGNETIPGGVVVGARVQFKKSGTFTIQIHDQNDTIVGHQSVNVNIEKDK